jgi:hypothetical protein
MKTFLKIAVGDGHENSIAPIRGLRISFGGYGNPALASLGRGSIPSHPSGALGRSASFQKSGFSAGLKGNASANPLHCRGIA